MAKVPAIVSGLLEKKQLRITAGECLEEILGELEQEFQKHNVQTEFRIKQDSNTQHGVFGYHVGNSKISITADEVEKRLGEMNRTRDKIKETIETIICEQLIKK